MPEFSHEQRCVGRRSLRLECGCPLFGQLGLELVDGLRSEGCELLTGGANGQLDLGPLAVRGIPAGDADGFELLERGLHGFWSNGTFVVIVRPMAVRGAVASMERLAGRSSSSSRKPSSPGTGKASAFLDLEESTRVGRPRVFNRRPHADSNDGARQRVGGARRGFTANC